MKHKISKNQPEQLQNSLKLDKLNTVILAMLTSEGA